MASKTYIQHYVNGISKKVVRKKQGRISSGLGKPKLVRLNCEDEEKMKILKKKFGTCWNENEFIRSCVSKTLSNSVYTELLKP